MVGLALMIEGQDGLTWQRWQRLLHIAETAGFDGVFRSDHFTNPVHPDKASLELWPSLTYAADRTSTIAFGPLVTPVTFRHPAVTARTAAAVDDLSGGRLVLGIGAGWQDREHRAFGIPFPSTSTRFEMLREYLEVVTRLLRSDKPATFRGRHYTLDDAILLPQPARVGGPPILIGGNGPTRTLPIATRYADEWNAVLISPGEYRILNAQLNDLLDDARRSRGDVKRSVMVGAILARDETDLWRRLSEHGRSTEELTDAGFVVGTPEMWIEQLTAYADAGAERIMLQWLNQDDIDGIQAIADQVLPALKHSD